MAKRRRKKGHYHTGVYKSTKTGAEISYRSGWEKLYCEWLDANPDVKTYLYEGVVIAYVNNARSKNLSKYFPDFLIEYVDGRKELIEIKPARKVEQKKVQKKAEAAKQWCSEHGASYKILTEAELHELGVL